MRRYLRFILPAGLIVVVLIFLLISLNSNLVFFHTPTEVLDGKVDTSRRFRLGGQVASETVVATSEGVLFQVTDGRQAVDVVHTGAPQQLFREGIGVVIEGEWDGSAFHSDTMLVKHDEQYGTKDGVYEEGDVPTPGALAQR